ncbi:hypothetical protein [Paramagnetospirillum kuznetsovii]|nr:hypothetical protein [Paramagnetospirillum kuznetsovii]
MMMRSFLMAALVVALSSAAMAQGSPVIDKGYEAAKASELEAVKLQLSTRQGPTAIAELTEADSALRRLREAKGTEARRSIASELESALLRLRLEADGSAVQDRK